MTLIFSSDAGFEATFKQTELANHEIKQVAGTLAQSASILNYYLYSSKGTVYQQNQFEHYIHQAAAQGQALTADFISVYYGKFNAHYYSSAVINDSQIAWEWTQISHFYMDYLFISMRQILPLLIIWLNI